MGESASSKSVSSLPGKRRGRNGGTQRWAGDDEGVTDLDDEGTGAATQKANQSFRSGSSSSRSRSSRSFCSRDQNGGRSTASSNTSSAPSPLLGDAAATVSISKGYIGTDRLGKHTIELRLFTDASNGSSFPRLLVSTGSNQHPPTTFLYHYPFAHHSYQGGSRRGIC
jgi:hypothetical protein